MMARREETGGGDLGDQVLSLAGERNQGIDTLCAAARLAWGLALVRMFE